MAIMYPNKPKECSINSKEDLMFEALEKLSDTYYVFHSFKIVNVIDEKMYESETDFVIFNPKTYGSTIPFKIVFPKSPEHLPADLS